MIREQTGGSRPHVRHSIIGCAFQEADIQYPQFGIALALDAVPNYPAEKLFAVSSIRR